MRRIIVCVSLLVLMAGAVYMNEAHGQKDTWDWDWDSIVKSPGQDSAPWTVEDSVDDLDGRVHNLEMLVKKLQKRIDVLERNQ